MVRYGNGITDRDRSEEDRGYLSLTYSTSLMVHRKPTHQVCGETIQNKDFLPHVKKWKILAAANTCNATTKSALEVTVTDSNNNTNNIRITAATCKLATNPQQQRSTKQLQQQTPQPHPRKLKPSPISLRLRETSPTQTANL